MPEIDGTTLQSAYQKIIALQQREWSAVERFNGFYRRLTQSYRKELEEAFYRYFVFPAGGTPHWDALAATQADVAGTLEDQFEETLQDLAEETEAATDTELEEAFLQGWYYAMWDVYQAGHDVGDVDPPDSEAINAVLVGAAIGGLTLIDRARRWLGEARLKHQMGIRAITRTDQTLPDTLTWFNGVDAFLQQRVSGLIESEVHRAFELGQRSAVHAFPNLLLGEVWVTRQDLAVCPLCRSRHMTITDLKPITDSHPGCRCFKIPLLEGAGTRPVDFEFFLSELATA